MRVTTFYSYKGGLGRSLLVAWAARALAAQHTVVALDLDLEAPGLPFKLGFTSQDDMGHGVVGLLRRFLRGEPAPDSLREWLRPVPQADRVWLLPAGPIASPSYWRDLAAISWREMFFGADPQGTRFFTWLRESIERDPGPDHLLIDSRTGVTEMGGAALSLLADQILALVGTAEEGIHGTREVLRAVMNAPRSPGRAVPRMGLVLARMPAELATPDLQRLRESVRATIAEEADPLTVTVRTELPLVIRSEPQLQVQERLALGTRRLRVHDDYEAVLSWIAGSPVPADVAGVVAPSGAPVEALRNSIEMQRQLAARDAARYLPDLAASLDNLSSALANEGRMEEALVVAEEAVESRRHLVGAGDNASLSGLVRSLSSLADKLSAVGRLREAVAVSHEVVDICRAHVAQDEARFLPMLAIGLNNLGNRLRAEGQPEMAASATEQAVRHLRTLARTRPGEFSSYLATTLSNFATMLIGVGRSKQAFEAGQEAVQLYREQGRAGAETRPDLARTLHNLGVVFGALGRPAEAFETAKESVDIYRQLVAEGRSEFLPLLAISLNNLGTDARACDRLPDALALTEESVRILRNIVADGGAFRADLAASLHNLGTTLHQLERREDALLAFKEAVESLRPSGDSVNLATSLDSLSRVQSSLGRTEALSSCRESVKLTLEIHAIAPSRLASILQERATRYERLLTERGEDPDRDPLVKEVRRVLTEARSRE